MAGPGRDVTATAPRTGSPMRRTDHSIRGLTTRGRCLLAGGLAAAVCAILLDERDLLRVGLLATALPLVALVVLTWRKPRFAALHRIPASHLTVGSVGMIEVRITNTARGRSPVTTIVESGTNGLTDGMACTLPPLRHGASAVMRYQFTASRRGRFEVGSLAAITTDPFGLATRRRAIPSTTSVLVLPPVVPLAAPGTVAGPRSAGNGVARSTSSGGDPDVRVRPYTAGDDIRTIHWRASAKRSEWVVRTREAVSHGAATVLIDHRAEAHTGGGRTASLEVAVTVAASACARLLGDNYRLRLTTHRGELLAAGADVTEQMLVALAEIHPDTATERGITCDFPAETGLLVAVTGALTESDARRLVASRPPSARAFALIINAASWPHTGGTRHSSLHGPESARSAAEILQQGGWSATVVDYGFDIRAAWQSVRTSDRVRSTV